MPSASAPVKCPGPEGTQNPVSRVQGKEGMPGGQESHWSYRVQWQAEVGGAADEPGQSLTLTSGINGAPVVSVQCAVRSKASGQQAAWLYFMESAAPDSKSGVVSHRSASLSLRVRPPA